MGAAKDARDVNGATAIWDAAGQGHFDVVRYLVDSGANLELGRTDDGFTPLHVAAYLKHLDIVRFLVEVGAAKDTVKNTGPTSLHFAVLCGHLDIVSFLVEAGANADQPLTHNGSTPLRTYCC